MEELINTKKVADKVDDLLVHNKVYDLFHKKEEKKFNRRILTFLAVIGAVAAVAAIAFAVYRFFTPDYLEDFEDDFDDDFDDDFFDDDDDDDDDDDVHVNVVKDEKVETVDKVDEKNC
jgi:hypothetical protein